MSLSSVSAETVEIGSKSILNVNMSNVTKLSARNYLMWSIQIQALLDGYNLSGHLDGTTPPPPATITNDGITTTNPEFTTWKRQDRLIFSGIIGAISPTVQPIVSTAKTVVDIWNTLAATYAKPTRGHIQQLKLQVKNWSKGTKTIDEYVQGLTTRFDQLALLGKPIEHEDQIEYILGGLNDDYKQVVDQLEGRDVTPSVTEVHEKLLNKEAKLLMLSSDAAAIPVTANVASTQHLRTQQSTTAPVLESQLQTFSQQQQQEVRKRFSRWLSWGLSRRISRQVSTVSGSRSYRPKVSSAWLTRC